MNIQVLKYHPSQKSQWDQMVENSVNGTFIHKRDYMEYHADRFADHSLMIYQGHKLIGILPAHAEHNILISHNGLTYGGWIWKENFTPDESEEIWRHVLQYLNNKGFEKLLMKEIPLFYYKFLTEKNRMVYDHFGEIKKKTIFWFIDTRKPIEKLLNRNRRRSLAQAQGKKIKIEPSGAWDVFWSILEKNLKVRHQAKPVHSLQEMKYLVSKFPRHIQLYLGYLDEEPVVGSVIYKKKKVWHFQYLSVLPGLSENRFMVDYLVWELIRKAYNNDYDFIGLGAAESKGQPDQNLVYWKYSFGAEPMAQFLWEFNV